MTKKIQINDLIPFLKPGFVAMDAFGDWYWYKKQPHISKVRTVWTVDNVSAASPDSIQALSIAFDIAKSDKEWDQSLIRINKNDRSNV